MTYRFNAKHLVLFLSLSVFFSCKKDDTSTPTPPEEPTMFEKVQGRWNAEIEAPPRNSNVSAKEQVIPKVVAIEFFSDSTYLVAFTTDEATTGKFKPVDSTSVNLSGEDIPSITDVKISEDSISFSYIRYDDVFTVKAAKAEDLTISADKKPLLKSWSLQREQEDGEYLFTGNNDLGEDATITFFFSPAGSLLIHVTDEGQDVSTQFLNWKWHPEVANAAKVYSIYGEAYSPFYYKIVSLTNTSLTVEEISTQGGSQQESRTYVLTAK